MSIAQEVVDDLEAAVGGNLTRATRLRQSVLGQAFSGRLVQQATRDFTDAVPPFSMAAETQARYRSAGRDSTRGTVLMKLAVLSIIECPTHL